MHGKSIKNDLRVTVGVATGESRGNKIGSGLK